MEHYVTLYDSLFLPQGLALHYSMERHAGEYTLWVLCMDDNVCELLKKLDLPNTQLLRLSSLETEELKRVKEERTKGEYCWTLTPFAPRFVFESDSTVERVTYIDADMWFRKSPSQIFKEFSSSGKQVLITDHAYAPEYDMSATSGQYCVQFMTFTRTGGEDVRKWWEERCVEWCYARIEDGKFGDQKYLDDWPERFEPYVHVLNNKELMLAPWNATRFPHGNAVLWHFHGLRLYASGKNSFGVHLGNYPLPKATRANIYTPYLNDMHHAVDVLESYGCTVRQQVKVTSFEQLKAWFRGAYHQLWRLNENLKMKL